MGDLLLGAENIQRFLDDRAAGEVFLLAFFRFLLDIFRHHLWPVDDGHVKFAHTDSFLIV